MKNKCATRSKKFRDQNPAIVRLFAVDLDVLQIAQIASVNQNPANRYLAAFLELIDHFCAAESPVKGELRLTKDTSALAELGAFAAVEPEKKIVFWPAQAKGVSFTEVVSDCARATLQGIFVVG